jgi:uncharacterized Zn finger protein (UPF0148 family)
MTTQSICPFCGAPLENYTGSQCPSCGNALPVVSGSEPGIITSPKPEYNNSAEVMDEVKKLVREGDSEAAAQVAATEFGLNLEAAHNTVEQVEVEMQHSGHEIPKTEPEPASFNPNPAPEVIDAPTYTSTQQPSNTRKWIIGGVIGAAIFLCVCCLLPILILIPVFRNGQ